MVKMWVEICLISARGVRASHSLWKRQWYAIGWIDPNNKYITKVDASTNTNPLWRTKFSVQLDNSEPTFQDLALNVEVYSRDPFFFTEKLHGSATVLLKEFLAKQLQNEEVGSYQLRKKKSGKPRGFVDVSIRVSEDKQEPNSHSEKFRTFSSSQFVGVQFNHAKISRQTSMTTQHKKNNWLHSFLKKTPSKDLDFARDCALL
ncbi:hypothetical protein TSUD_244780 [Trifolium subterraneum]|uniref:C2 domain-containing protein n=1 Tax=Trifolium subterraneum TaxID=3900 RepID=A0A2Z6NYL6_TRISU|nr:hypothetical protein TSUD_244780 [Trifolium subterraneum]